MSVGVRVRPKKLRLHDQYIDPLSCVADNRILYLRGATPLVRLRYASEWQCQATRDAGSSLPHYGPIPSACILSHEKRQLHVFMCVSS